MVSNGLSSELYSSWLKANQLYENTIKLYMYMISKIKHMLVSLPS